MNRESQMRRKELYQKFMSSSERFEQLEQLIKRLFDDRYQNELLSYRQRLDLTEMCEILIKSMYLFEIEKMHQDYKYQDEQISKTLLNDEQLIERLLQDEHLSRNLISNTSFLIKQQHDDRLSHMHGMDDYRDYLYRQLNWMLHDNPELLSKLYNDREQIKLLIEIELDKRNLLHEEENWGDLASRDADAHEFRGIRFNKRLISESK
jgi:hypothetical protein